MRIQPRQELLAIWKAIAKWSVDGGSWNWDGHAGRNSISDAEQLLCLLLPPTKLSGLGFDVPDVTSADTCAALESLGSAVEIPQRVVRLIKEYTQRYSDPTTGVPIFPGGSYFVVNESSERPPTEEQRQLGVVDSFATSVVLTTAIIDFLRGYRPAVQRESYQREIDEAELAAQRRLTAAMVGLQRSFSFNVFRADSKEGRALCRTVSQREDFSPDTVAKIRRSLQDIMVGLRELGASPDRVADLAGNPDLLFECGWSWGVVRDAPTVKTEAMGEFSDPGVAEPAPYLYFTVVAVDGIRDLFTGQARIRGLLNDEQQQLARTLNLQWELARQYWANLASFGEPRWALEDIPWRTTDEDETDYYSLLVTSLVLQDLTSKRGSDTDLIRIGRILEELADRSRITRRPLAADPGLSLHDPGARVALVGSDRVSEGAPQLGWVLVDLSTLVLGLTLSVAGQVNDPRWRARLLTLADNAWAHIERRRLSVGRGAGLWDQPANVYPSLTPRGEIPSWYFTTRVVKFLGTAADLVQSKPPPGQRLADTAAELLAEAEHAFDSEQLLGSGEAGPSLSDSLRQQTTSLLRARTLVATRPGTAVALLSEVLRELDKLAAAREHEAGE